LQAALAARGRGFSFRNQPRGRSASDRQRAQPPSTVGPGTAPAPQPSPRQRAADGAGRAPRRGQEGRLPAAARPEKAPLASQGYLRDSTSELRAGQACDTSFLRAGCTQACQQRAYEAPAHQDGFQEINLLSY